MSMLVESLQRLYAKGKVTNEKLKSMIGKSITQEDYDMIVG